MGKTGTTRAIAAAVNGGVTGAITSAQELAQHRGFGVFGYYTVEKDYLGTTSVAWNKSTPPAISLTSSQASAMYANFMYNQEIIGTDEDTPSWTYSPVKYWPNGNTIADDQDNNAGSSPAEGSVGGKVSFFAYAPYVGTVGTTGITAMSGASATGNPTITYKLSSTPSEVVDLLWGTAGTNGYKAQEGTETQAGNYIAVDPTGTPKWAERPFMVNANLTKMKVDGKVQFNFKHALSKVGGSKVGSTTENGLQVVLDVDNGSAETGGTFNNSETKVTVSNITITARGKVDTNADNNADKYLTAAGNVGTLDLATGQWTMDVATAANVTDEKASAYSMTYTILRTGGTATLNDDIVEPASLEKTTEAWTSLVSGVTPTAKNVFKEDAVPLVYIPGTFPELDIQITYITRTKDDKLNDKYSEVIQTVKKTLTFGEAVQLNKQYNIIIHLGLTSVKFDATVSDWDPDINEDGSITSSDDKVIYLPINVSD